MDRRAAQCRWARAAASVDGRVGNIMARSEAAGKTGVSDAPPDAPAGVALPGITAGADVTIRKCETLDDMQACFSLQKEVWKFADAELVPVRMFVVAAKI